MEPQSIVSMLKPVLYDLPLPLFICLLLLPPRRCSAPRPLLTTARPSTPAPSLFALELIEALNYISLDLPFDCPDVLFIWASPCLRPWSSNQRERIVIILIKRVRIGIQRLIIVPIRERERLVHLLLRLLVAPATVEDGLLYRYRTWRPTCIQIVSLLA